MRIGASKKVIKCLFTYIMFNNLFTCSAVQYVLCLNCARLLYKPPVNNGEIEVGPDSSQVATINVDEPHRRS